MLIRALHPSDEELYRELMNSLTDRDRYLRFFHVVRELGPAEIVPFVIDRADMIGLVAVEDGRALGAAHGFVDGTRAEVSIAVRPEMRRHGIGGKLLGELIEELRGRGVREVVAHSLHENREFGELAREAHMHGQWEDGGVTQWRLRLDEPPA